MTCQMNMSPYVLYRDNEIYIEPNISALLCQLTLCRGKATEDANAAVMWLVDFARKMDSVMPAAMLLLVLVWNCINDTLSSISWHWEFSYIYIYTVRNLVLRYLVYLYF